MDYLEERNLKCDFICTEDKKNIFLIGDSIREGYCHTVKEELLNVANVFFINDNNRNTQFLITNLKSYSTMFNCPALVDIVHFNCGHWDIAHWDGSEFSLTSINEYIKNLETIIELIKKLFINAKIVFATTTPMNPSGEVGINIRTNNEIDEYNFAAKQVCDKNKILLNDINAYVKNWGAEYYKDYAHYTEQSNILLGKEIAKRLNGFLI